MKFLKINEYDITELLNQDECDIEHITFSNQPAGYRAVLDMCFKPLNAEQMLFLCDTVGLATLSKATICFEDKQCRHYERKGSLIRVSEMLIMSLKSRDRGRRGTAALGKIYPTIADESGLFHNMRLDLQEMIPFVPNDWISVTPF